MLFGETVAVYCENSTERTDTFREQSVPHRKHDTSPLQSPPLHLHSLMPFKFRKMSPVVERRQFLSCKI
jgi:hypothetical protein